jgi:hypothetical protein
MTEKWKGNQLRAEDAKAWGGLTFNNQFWKVIHTCQTCINSFTSMT